METGREGGRVRADINVTPLVDIVLVLLIIFIVITPAVSNAVRLPLARHSVKAGPASGAGPLNLTYSVLRDPSTGRATGPGRVTVDDARDREGNPISFRLEDPEGRRRLKELVAGAVKAPAGRRVFVKADADLAFRYVNELLTVCREGGAGEASIVTGEDRRPEEGE